MKMNMNTPPQRQPLSLSFSLSPPSLGNYYDLIQLIGIFIWIGWERPASSWISGIIFLPFFLSFFLSSSSTLLPLKPKNKKPNTAQAISGATGRIRRRPWRSAAVTRATPTGRPPTSSSGAGGWWRWARSCVRTTLKLAQVPGPGQTVR